MAAGLQINFAHRTFAWKSEAKGKAAVHVVIIGFAYQAMKHKTLFDYPTIEAEPVPRKVTNISPYLIESDPVIIENRTKPLCHVSSMVYGNKPVEGGYLLLVTQEKNELIAKEPAAEKWIRPLLGAEEFINGKERWCLWLVEIKANELRAMPEVMRRVQGVKEIRLASKKLATVKLADTPTLFGENRQPLAGTYILVPCHSSERREYVPMDFCSKEIISHNSALIIPNATLYEFGVLESKMHMTWMRTIAGRLESRYRYSAKLVYNNYPWPDANEQQKQSIATAAQKVLDARAEEPESTLADLYDPLAMPVNLKKAHTALDKLVEKAYRNLAFKDDAQRIAFLFTRYQALVEAEK